MTVRVSVGRVVVACGASAYRPADYMRRCNADYSVVVEVLLFADTWLRLFKMEVLGQGVGAGWESGQAACGRHAPGTFVSQVMSTVMLFAAQCCACGGTCYDEVNMSLTGKGDGLL